MNIELEGYTIYSHQISKKRTNPIGNLMAWKNKYEVIKTNFTSSALIVKFSNFTIANVHLKAGLHSGADVRIKQMQSILKFEPTIIVGDFNDEL